MSDPIAVDPGHYSVELDNDHVRVLRVKYNAGEKSAMHAHPLHIGVSLTDGTIRMHLPDGTTEDLELTAGQIIEGPAGTHLPENIGGAPFEAILVEIKGAS